MCNVWFCMTSFSREGHFAFLWRGGSDTAGAITRVSVLTRPKRHSSQSLLKEGITERWNQIESVCVVAEKEHALDKVCECSRGVLMALIVACESRVSKP